MKYKQLLRGMLASGFLLMGIQAEAKTVQVTLHAVETDVPTTIREVLIVPGRSTVRFPVRSYGSLKGIR